MGRSRRNREPDPSEDRPSRQAETVSRDIREVDQVLAKARSGVVGVAKQKRHVRDLVRLTHPIECPNRVPAEALRVGERREELQDFERLFTYRAIDGTGGTSKQRSPQAGTDREKRDHGIGWNEGYRYERLVRLTLLAGEIDYVLPTFGFRAVE